MTKDFANTEILLIIDDDPNFREIFSAKLTAAGYKVETADSGETGIKKAKELKPRLILMDMQMPSMSGADALVKLRDQEETKETKVVFLTSFGDVGMESTEKLMATELGALDYLKKTEDLDALIEKIKTYIT
jgi:DNA-binding response OmpR family regulator